MVKHDHVWLERRGVRVGVLGGRNQNFVPQAFERQFNCTEIWQVPPFMVAQ